MEVDSRPELRGRPVLGGLGAHPLREWERALLKSRLGTLELEREAIVADIEDEVLLGYDILGGGKDGPADILLSKNVIVLCGTEIPCIQRGKRPESRREVVADDTLVPGLAETLIDVYIDRYVDDDRQTAHFLVEPSHSFQERYPLRMASTLVDLNGGPTCKVRVLNPLPTTVKLFQDAEIGKAKGIERIVSVVSEAENIEEQSDMNIPTRRIQLQQVGQQRNKC